MVTDIVGREIKVDDLVAYCVSNGDASLLRIGKVKRVIHNKHIQNRWTTQSTEDSITIVCVEKNRFTGAIDVANRARNCKNPRNMIVIDSVPQEFKEVLDQL